MGTVAAFITSKGGRRKALELRRENHVYVNSCMRNNSALYERAGRAPVPTPALIKAKLSFAGYCCDEIYFEVANVFYDHCVRWSETLFAPRDSRTSHALNLQADFYTDSKDPATAAKLHERLLRLQDNMTSVNWPNARQSRESITRHRPNTGNCSRVLRKVRRRTIRGLLGVKCRWHSMRPDFPLATQQSH